MKKKGPFFYRPVVAAVIFFSIASTGMNQAIARASEGLETATIAWVQKKQTASELYYCQYEDGRWQRPKQLTQTGATNFLPTVEMNGKNETFIVWSSTQGIGFQLNFAIIKNGKVSKGPAEMLTGFSSNLGPSLAYDRKRSKMLLVWAGSNGEADDIFLSEYSNNSWSAPSRIHPENEVSDYLPNIIVDPNGSIKVEWQATLAEEGPHEFSTVLYSGTVNKTAPGHLEKLHRLERKAAIENCVTRLPDGIDLDDSSIAFKCKGNTPKQVKYLGSYMRKVTN